MNNLVCVRKKVARVSQYCVGAVIGLSSMASLAQDSISVNTEDSKKTVVSVTGIPPAAPVFYTANTKNSVYLGNTKVEQSILATLNVVQGEPKVLSLELVGDSSDLKIVGAQLESWSVRKNPSGNKVFLDLVPKDPKAKKLDVVITKITKREDDLVKVLTLGPASASGFQHQLDIKWEAGAHVELSKVEGCQPVALSRVERRSRKSLVSSGISRVEARFSQAGSAFSEVELRNLSVEAKASDDGKSAVVHLTGDAVVRDADGGSIELITGPMVLQKFPMEKGYSFALTSDRNAKNSTRYTIDFEKNGSYELDLEFAVSLEQVAGWTGLRFRIPHAPVVPVSLSGVPQRSRFLLGQTEVEGAAGVTRWQTYVPASGQCLLRWKPKRKDSSGELFFTTQALVDVQVGAGMLRERTQIDIKVLQGKVRKLQMVLDGAGDVLDLQGPHVGSWMVKKDGDKRLLEIVLNGERTDVGSITILTQHPIGNFPAKVKPLQITPVGAMRHAGYVRLSNRGAVKLGVSSHKGMMQLAPTQFPEAGLGAPAGKQVFVYRFPAAERSWEVVADQILPEVSVNEVLIYKLSETDRELHADVELDIREAPLREWDMRIPADYAVASVTSAEMGQMVVGRTVTDGQRSLKVTFKKAVIGRQLIKVRLARNVATAEGEWSLAKLSYPRAKTVRGNLGVEAALGWRVVSSAVDKLVEMPLAYFPNKSPNLQQAFRLREAEWSATMQIEALEQSVQADVFHLYSLKEGMAYGSVLVNYFVVGAPMHEWKIKVPKLGEQGEIGNVMVEGQNVRSWRQEGDQLIVSLHQPTLGGSTLLVSFEKPMSARGGAIDLGNVQPLDAKTESGFIQVVSPTQVKQSVNLSSGLLKLGATELPAEYRLMSSAPSLASWQYATRGFELQLGIEWYDPSNTVEQVVDFASLSTQVSRDGAVVTEAKFFVKTRGRKALEMRLPENATLLEVRADGQALNARKDGEIYLLPLPAKVDPNAPVKVELRYGGSSDNPSRPVVSVPVLSAPVVISEWKVRSDRGYLLDVVGGNVLPVEPNLTETGFEWIQSRMVILVGALLLLLAGAWTCGRASSGGWKPWIGALWLVLAAVISLNTAMEAKKDRRVNSQSFEVVAPVVSPDQEITLELSNQPKSAAMRSTTWTLVASAGAIFIVASVFMGALQAPWMRAIAMAAVGLGLLGQRGGAIPFFLVLALVAGLLMLQLGWKWMSGVRIRRAARGVREAAMTALIVLGLAMMPDTANAAEIADSIEQRWDVRGERVYADADVLWQANEGESILLVEAPASLTSIISEGTRVNKLIHKGKVQWFLVAERSGLISAKIRYEMPVKGLADRLWTIPTGDSAVRQLLVTIDRANWEITSEQAILHEVVENTQGSSAKIHFAPIKPMELKFKPMGRDPKTEETRLFVESADLYIPSPGVVDGWHTLSIRPVSGELDHLTIVIPEGMMVGDVLGQRLEDWRFDPKSRELNVQLAEAQSKRFTLLVQTQRGMDTLPQALTLSPLRVREADSVVGVLGLAFGDDAQPDALKPTSLATANLSDFSGQLWKQARGQHGDAVLQKVYRYGKDQAKLSLQVDPVAPELRVISKQRLSLAEERMLLAVTSDVEIVRAGVFELRYTIPDGMEVESISGSALRDWTEIETDGKRYAQLQLTGRTLGKQQFHLNFTGTSPVMHGSVADWKVPHVELVSAMRQTGELLVVPEQGIRVRVVNRQHVTQQDARQSGTHRKGDLAFRLLQSDWNLHLGIEKLDPWVRATCLQEMSLREGQTRTRLSLDYMIENAAVKVLHLRLPGLSADEAKTVRASGGSVKEMVQVDGDKWELRLRRGIIGKVAFEVEFQRSVDQRDGKELLRPVQLEGVRQVKHYVTVRSSGRLDIRATDVLGWRASDWSAVPKKLRNKADSSVPALCYLLSEPEAPLAVAVKRHEIAKTLKLRVLESKFTSLFSADQSALTLAELIVRVVEKDTMHAVLPDGAQLFSVTVNGESVEVVSQGSEQLFYVTAGAEDDERAEVKMMYRTPAKEKASKQISLKGPSFSAPLEKIDWYVSLPEGYRLTGRGNTFDFMGGEDEGAVYGMKEYQSSMTSQKQQQAELAGVQIDQANSWISSGDYKKAEKVLSQVSKNRAVDAAYNEDARVQLRNLRNQQAVMGLNTRRQKLYLENKSVGNMVQANQAFEDAANNNPLFQGKDNYYPGQVEELLMGNSAEERDAMQRIADRMVSQQLAAQPAPQTIEVTLPQAGTLLHFSRASQLNPGTPLVLELEIEHPSDYGIGHVIGLLAILFAAGILLLLLRKNVA
ncbi:MAG: hypothetical protein ACI9FG_000140 [Crocinitomicaceae bacterium]|jgi:hypothetical protein